MHKGNNQGDNHPSAEHNHDGPADHWGKGAEDTRQITQPAALNTPLRRPPGVKVHVGQVA